MDSDSDIDSMSQCTATDVGVRELRKDGIHIEEIAPQVKKNVEKIPNDFVSTMKTLKMAIGTRFFILVCVTTTALAAEFIISLRLLLKCLEHLSCSYLK